MLATGFATDFFDSEGELGTGEGLESLQPMKVATPKTVSGARQYAEKTYIPSALDEKINYDSAPTRQNISSDRETAQEKKGATAQSRSNDSRVSPKRQSRKDDEEDEDNDTDENADRGSSRDSQSQRDRDSDPKRYKGIRGFFRKIFD